MSWIIFNLTYQYDGPNDIRAFNHRSDIAWGDIIALRLFLTFNSVLRLKGQTFRRPFSFVI